MRRVFTLTFLLFLILSEFLFFYLTNVSNQHLYFINFFLKEAGYIIIPDKTVLSSLLEFNTTLFSSYFITLTAGAIIAFFISILISAFFITRESFFKIIEIFIPITIAIAFVGTTLYIYEGKDLFSRFQDSFLHSSKTGESINSFYYKYTLHAAEVMKTPMQKQIKPCWIDPKIKNRSKLKKTLFQFGWLPIKKKIDSELVIEKDKHLRLIFKYQNRIILKTNLKKFITNPEKFLELYSLKTDSKKNLRTPYSTGLMPGIPLFIFFFVYLILFLCFRILTNSKNSNLIASTLTCLLLILLLFYLNPEILHKTNQANAVNMLSSQNEKTRIRGLRVIYTQKYTEDISNVVPELLRGGTAEKYWLANTLGMQNSRQNRKVLKILIKDDSIKVQCAAINALSKIDKTKKTFILFKKIIKTSNHWYVQYYAYNAYREWIIKNNSN